MPHSIDPDQTLHSVAFDLGLQCLIMHFLIPRVDMVMHHVKNCILAKGKMLYANQRVELHLYDLDTDDL